MRDWRKYQRANKGVLIERRVYATMFHWSISFFLCFFLSSIDPSSSLSLSLSDVHLWQIDRDTPLHVAVNTEQVPMIKVLLDAGASINVQNEVNLVLLGKKKRCW